MIWLFFILWQGLLARLSGNGFGARWGLSWLPELLFSLPFGFALGWALNQFGLGFAPCLVFFALGWGISYAGMQSATWMFLQWGGHDEPQTQRSATLKPLVDWLAGKLGYSLGDEGYSWIAAALKGFIIGLPVGGVLNAALWPMAYDTGDFIGSKLGIDRTAVSEVLSGVGGGIAILLFSQIINLIAG